LPGFLRSFRLTPTAVGDQREGDSDPDYSGVTPPFTLGVGEPNVRPATAADGVEAAYINPTIDAGVTPLRYAVGNRVWLDQNSDGIQQPDERAGSATVSLLTDTGNLVATTTTDAAGRYQFSNLRAGRYRLQFTSLPAHRTFTERAAGADPGWIPTLIQQPDGLRFSSWRRERQIWCRSPTPMPARPTSRIKPSALG
jgi:hypothetical protein